MEQETAPMDGQRMAGDSEMSDPDSDLRRKVEGKMRPYVKMGLDRIPFHAAVSVAVEGIKAERERCRIRAPKRRCDHMVDPREKYCIECFNPPTEPPRKVTP